MSTARATLAPLFQPLDAARSRVLRVLAPHARAWIVDRDARVGAVGAASISLALAVTCFRPLWLLALGPIVWGVPHLVADVRYLVARPSLHRRPAAIAAALVAAIGLALGFGVRAGLAAAALAAIASPGSRLRRGLVASTCAIAIALAQIEPWKADVVFVQAHNLLAIALWFAWRRSAKAARVAPLVVFAAGAALLFTAPLAKILAPSALEAPFANTTVASFAESLSTSSDASLTLRLVLFFAFAQSAHYIVWLRLLPEDARKAPTPRSFAQTWRALEKDVGAIGLAIAAAAAFAIVAVAVVSVSHARDLYLGVAYFHGYLELIAVAIFTAQGSVDRRAG